MMKQNLKKYSDILKLKYILTSMAVFLAIITVYYGIPPESVMYYEIDHGVIVDSSQPNIMDAFTISAYLKNTKNKVVEVKPFRYSFTIVDASRVNNTVSNIIKQEETLKLRPKETIIIHQETIFPDKEKTYHIFVIGKKTTLTVEGWDKGLSQEYAMSKHDVTVALERYTWEPNETIRLTVHNEGNSRIMTGVGYRLQKYVNESWHRYSPTTPSGDGFIMVGISISPNSSYDHKVPISHLEEGYYRIMKSVSFGNGTDHMLTYVTEFEITKSYH